MGIRLVAGRTFTEADNAGGPRVAIVNEALAQQLSSGQNPVGQQLRLWNWLAVVGVIGKVRHSGLGKPVQGELFLPDLQQQGTPNSVLVVQSYADPLSPASAIRRRIRDYRPDQPIVEIGTMEQVVADSVAQPRFYTTLLGIFAALALVLALVGVYGVISNSVSQRRHEIGIRMALGARSQDILSHFLKQGARCLIIGVLLGLGGVLTAARLLSNLPSGIEQTDPLTYATASLLLSSAALAAIYLPARRATKADPLVVFRCE